MIDRRKTRYELERDRQGGDAPIGCVFVLFAFLIGFLMGWIANGVWVY